MAIPIPRPKYDTHPHGPNTGEILAIEDMGEQDTPWGKKPKVALTILSDELNQDDQGEIKPYVLVLWYTLSSGKTAHLTKLRQKMYGHELTKDEREALNSAELEGRSIAFTVIHKEGRDGGIFAAADDIHPIDEDVRPDHRKDIRAAYDAKQSIPDDDEPQTYDQENDDLPF